MRHARPQAEHPRVRGENKCVGRNRFTINGTSPRARGKHGANQWPAPQNRNIPACAGKTHPRYARVLDKNGTSPRARGKQAVVIISIENARNIPACAGKTSGVNAGQHVQQEHPRVRGENDVVQAARDFFPGTSPRERGKRLAPYV